MIVVGTTTSLDVVWSLADTFNGLMAIPNFIALFALSGVVAKLTKEYFSQKKKIISAFRLSLRIKRGVVHGNV